MAMLTPLQEKWTEVKALTYEMKDAGWPDKGHEPSPLFATLTRAWKNAVDDAYAFEASFKTPMLQEVRKASTTWLKQAQSATRSEQYIGQRAEFLNAVGKELARRQGQCRECRMSGSHKMDCSVNRRSR